MKTLRFVGGPAGPSPAYVDCGEQQELGEGGIVWSPRPFPGVHSVNTYMILSVWEALKLAENHELLLSDSVIYSCLITYGDHLITRQIKQEGLFILGSGPGKLQRPSVYCDMKRSLRQLGFTLTKDMKTPSQRTLNAVCLNKGYRVS